MIKAKNIAGLELGIWYWYPPFGMVLLGFDDTSKHDADLLIRKEERPLPVRLGDHERQVLH